MPLAFMMGVPYDESFTVAELIGIKLFLNEFVAYQKLSELKLNRLIGLDEIIGGQRQWISVSKQRNATYSVAKHDVIETIFKMVQYHILCVTSPVADALRDYLHLRSLWFCQLQFAWNCDWRPVWVFRHSFTIWRYTFLDDEWPNCFLSQKASICPPRRGDISSLVLRAMITGTCVSLVNACIAGKRFFN